MGQRGGGGSGGDSGPGRTAQDHGRSSPGSGKGGLRAELSEPGRVGAPRALRSDPREGRRAGSPACQARGPRSGAQPGRSITDTHRGPAGRGGAWGGPRRRARVWDSSPSPIVGSLPLGVRPRLAHPVWRFPAERASYTNGRGMSEAILAWCQPRSCLPDAGQWSWLGLGFSSAILQPWEPTPQSPSLPPP